MTKFKAGDRVMLIGDSCMSDYIGKIATVRERGTSGKLESYLQNGYLPVRFDRVDYGDGPTNCHSGWSPQEYRHLTKLELALT